MATKQIYDRCVKRNCELGRKDFYTGSFKPNMAKIFSRKRIIVDEFQFGCGSESDKRRHLYEDNVLRFLYLEN